MVKAYLRYQYSGSVGVVVSPSSNIVYGWNDNEILVGALENVLVWDAKKASLLGTYRGDRHQVTRIARSPDQKNMAVGYSNGSVTLVDLKTGTIISTFHGHTGAITSLCFDAKGFFLASGATDSDVIVWDVVGETGLFKLHGHKGPITQCEFLMEHKMLVSSSKDTLLKVWDLETQHCVYTLTSHRSEIWSFIIDAVRNRLITGCADNELRIFHIRGLALDQKLDTLESKITAFSLEPWGSIYRTSKDRVISMAINVDANVLACCGADKMVEFFYFRNEAEIKKKLARRAKRLREKDSQVSASSLEVTPSDAISSIHILKCPSKICSLDFHPLSTDATRNVSSLSFAISFNNNLLQTYTLMMKGKETKTKKFSSVESPGHRSDIRSLAISSDDLMILSTSNNSLKVWNRHSGNCIRSIDSGYGLCATFVPGNRNVIVGTKTGQLQIFDISSATLIQSIDAHQGAIWSMQLAPEKRGIVTGGADKEVKFWNFELTGPSENHNNHEAQTLNLVHSRTLKMSDDVLCVRYSANQKYLAVSLLDATVKVFFADSLKFYLSLYGHKLPVLSIDISDDSTLIATGSADKNIKIWGLDFGDCHKSIFAHKDSVTCVRFVPKTHYLFSASKDKTLSYWDADTFENISTLEGHCAEVWSIEISSRGDFLVSGSHDRSLRIWDKTEEQLFIEEEREKEREKLFDDSFENQNVNVTLIGKENEGEIAFPGKHTIESIKSGEQLMEAIDLVVEEEEKLSMHQKYLESNVEETPLAPPPLNPIFIALKLSTPNSYLQYCLRKIKSSDLEEVLLVLPISYVVKFFVFLQRWIQSGWFVDLTVRCILFLLKIHQNQIISNHMMISCIETLRFETKKQAIKLKNTAGFNMAALQYLKRTLEEEHHVEFFSEKIHQRELKKKKVVNLM